MSGNKFQSNFIERSFTIFWEKFINFINSSQGTSYKYTYYRIDMHEAHEEDHLCDYFERLDDNHVIPRELFVLID